MAAERTGTTRSIDLAALQESIKPGVVLVTETGESLLAQHMLDGRHVVAADEPETFGGSDTGPTPYELLMMSLGACTAMTLRLYARRKGLPLEHIQVRLNHKKIHAEDCEECEAKTGYLDRIEVTLELDGPLDEAQRARLLEIAGKCPVHKTLTSEVVLRNKLAPK